MFLGVFWVVFLTFLYVYWKNYNHIHWCDVCFRFFFCSTPSSIEPVPMLLNENKDYIWNRITEMVQERVIIPQYEIMSCPTCHKKIKGPVAAKTLFISKNIGEPFSVCKCNLCLGTGKKIEFDLGITLKRAFISILFFPLGLYFFKTTSDSNCGLCDGRGWIKRI